ncbi:hypothetical protein BD413DRAFT_84315 [Trametes elegans]|nr:hypothetical protein BD413DRAFT_84315 [Trametes elegans]
MGSVSSLSPICGSPPTFGHQTRSGEEDDSRPCTPRIRTNTSQAFQHPRSPSSPGSGSRGRFRDWDQQECLPSSSKLPAFSSRRPPSDTARHASRGFSAQTPPSSSNVRTRSSVGSSRNEVSPVFRVGGLGCRMFGFQAHQSEHAPTQRTTRVSPLVLTQLPTGSLNQAPSLSSSLTSAPSFSAPPTPRSQASPLRRRAYRQSAFVTPSPSTASLRSDARACEPTQARCEPPTPSPASRTHASRGRSRPGTRSSPLVAPPTFTIRRGLVPPRARPTLAMSLQVHAPTPVMSTRPMSPVPSSARTRSRSRPPPSSRPSSPLTSTVPLPQRTQMTRPPSRSERLLRDTLRRAEEQERLVKPQPAPSYALSQPSAGIPPSVEQLFSSCRMPAAADGGRRHRRTKSSSVRSDSSCEYFEGEALDEDSQEDEEDADWLWRANSAGSLSSMTSSHGYSHAYYPVRPAPARKAESAPYGTPVSPSPARVQLQRAAKSSPTVPRRHSHSHERPSHQPGTPLTPHEAVLRSRLEGVLKGAKTGGDRTRSSERRDAEHGLSSGSGNSMASSRNLSGEGDFFFGMNGDSSLTSLSSNESKPVYTTKPRASMPPSPRKRQNNLHMPPPPVFRQASSPGAQKAGVSPLTPPPSPPFNVRQAAAQVKGMDGYISFANIEGLGVPGGSDEDSEDDARSRSRWFQWLHLNSGRGAIAGDRSRGRSESASSSS